MLDFDWWKWKIFFIKRNVEIFIVFLQNLKISFSIFDSRVVVSNQINQINTTHHFHFAFEHYWWILLPNSYCAKSHCAHYFA